MNTKQIEDIMVEIQEDQKEIKERLEELKGLKLKAIEDTNNANKEMMKQLDKL